MSLFFSCCLYSKGRSQGAGGEPCCSAWSLCKAETVGHKGSLFPLPPHIKPCLCHTEQKHPAVCKLLCVWCQHLCVCACMCSCLQFPPPWGALLCTQQCIHTGVAHVWCLLCHVQKAHSSECLPGLGGFFAELDECHGIIPNVLPLLLMRSDQKMFTKHNFFFNVSNFLECFNWLHYWVLICCNFSSQARENQGPAFGLGANGLIYKFSKYWALQDKEIL